MRLFHFSLYWLYGWIMEIVCKYLQHMVWFYLHSPANFSSFFNLTFSNNRSMLNAYVYSCKFPELRHDHMMMNMNQLTMYSSVKEWERSLHVSFFLTATWPLNRKPKAPSRTTEATLLFGSWMVMRVHISKLCFPKLSRSTLICPSINIYQS